MNLSIIESHIFNESKRNLALLNNIRITFVR